MSPTKKSQLSGRRSLATIAAPVAVAVVSLAVFLQVRKTEAENVTVYMSPYCGCCSKWVGHLQQHGFTVETRLVEDIAPIRSKYGVSADLASCHTALVGGYVIEGHVPASDIRRLLEQRPTLRGIAAPGMPGGAPGMESATREPFTVFAIQDDGAKIVFARH